MISTSSLGSTFSVAKPDVISRYENTDADAAEGGSGDNTNLSGEATLKTKRRLFTLMKVSLSSTNYTLSIKSREDVQPG